MLNTYKLERVDGCLNCLTRDQKKGSIEYCHGYVVFPNVCDWYEDADKFYADWCGQLKENDI